MIGYMQNLQTGELVGTIEVTDNSVMTDGLCRVLGNVVKNEADLAKRLNKSIGQKYVLLAEQFIPDGTEMFSQAEFGGPGSGPRNREGGIGRLEREHGSGQRGEPWTSTLTGIQWRATGDVSPLSTMLWNNSKAQKTFSGVAGVIDRLHGADADRPVEVTFGRKTTSGAGGNLKSSGNGGQWPTRAQIMAEAEKMAYASGRVVTQGLFSEANQKLVDRFEERQERSSAQMKVYNALDSSLSKDPDGLYRWHKDGVPNVLGNTYGKQNSETFAHEYGHHLDIQGRTLDAESGKFVGTPESRIKTSDQNVGDDSPAAVAQRGFLDAVRSTKEFSEIDNFAGKRGFKDYLRDPKELWARAYSQWVLSQATEAEGGPAMMAGLENPPHQWDPVTFQNDVAPHVEAVLESFGLMEKVK